MAEVKEMDQAPQTEALEQTAPAPAETGGEQAAKRKPMSPKKRRRLIRRVVALVVVLALAAAGFKFLGGKGEEEGQVVVDVVQYGSITSVVESSGLTKAKNSETITLTTAGTVTDVFVTEGQMVNEGDPLFIIDSPAAQTAVEKARSNVEGYEKQLATAQKDIAGLNLAPSYPGKLMDTVTLNPGDSISKGQKVATLADDTRLRLTQYYSYAYEGRLKAGQTVDVSIPALMTTVPGRVDTVHMVSRITPEGSKLFSAEIILENEGALTADMTASATTVVNGETVYPYEPGKLEYYRVGDLCSTVSGTVISSSLVDYLQVTSGQVLVRIDGEESESEIFTIQQSMETAQEELRVAEENLANCSAVAPISGKVIGLAVSTGGEVAANTAVVTISDTSTITVNANVDERYISYIKPGMMVELDQWGTFGMGTVESVSLSSTINNGVATYPVVISADNYDETLQVNSNINFKITASQNDNCLVLPIQSVRTVGLEDGSMATVVYVKADSMPENAIEVPYADEEIPEGFWPVPVEIGIQDNYNVEIKSGVEEGTEVFTQILSAQVWG
ncbi:HlyD family efflux transporter periplasmic adaptor subunit [Dysosmobacter sp.]|uniref:HlyD family efflux transporter periplasmic adaptor subunit n=1 Tax=Dysosmobacter sp. TaxID=2591382 RepID=UPI002A8F595C|nr:HlyD family efflux transporter periplasmic adaptor subunit [Dysosmobacter sp.]MDY3985190.1 HlyD family efflux transporter periplasmic adaptor subunit [Dysosmobacter sp.]